MNAALSRNVYFIKEHVGMFKAANNYDIHDPETGEIVMECREERLGLLTKILRFTDFKRLTPFDIRIMTPSGQPIVRVKRGVSLFLSKVHVLDENDRHIGGFKQKLFSIGGAFNILDENDKPMCTLKGKWHSWNFRFMAGDTELANITKKWEGIGKNLFTSADNYMLQISDSVPAESAVRQLIFAAVMCIDMVLKE